MSAGSAQLRSAHGPVVTERVALRRLYRARGCSMSDRAEFTHEFRIGPSLWGHLYLGPFPRFGLWESSGERYAAPGASTLMMKANFVGSLRERGDSSSFFCEIAAIHSVEVDEDVSGAARAGDQPARAAILSKAAAVKPDATIALDLVAGIVGLRFHRQFVLDLLNENEVAIIGDDYTSNYAGTWIEMLQEVALSTVGVEALASQVSALSDLTAASVEALGNIFHWLLRFWPERDPVSRFLALFIPLEAALQGIGVPMDAEAKASVRAIRKAIKATTDPEKAGHLKYFNGLVERLRPSLEQRFAIFAQRAGLKGWEADVEAFARFNRIRNQLLHRGSPRVEFRLEISQEVIRTLEDLVERYVSIRVFGDDAVYPSTWRPSRERDA